tara:strand:- start:114 stop:311 length:198 start_codon:yes stop_codon:yes gene_type:complete
MTNINDRIGSQNVIRVLSNVGVSQLKIIEAIDLDTTLKTTDGVILVWDVNNQEFVMTDAIDGGEY